MRPPERKQLSSSGFPLNSFTVISGGPALRCEPPEKFVARSEMGLELELSHYYGAPGSQCAPQWILRRGGFADRFEVGAELELSPCYGAPGSQCAPHGVLRFAHVSRSTAGRPQFAISVAHGGGMGGAPGGP